MAVSLSDCGRIRFLGCFSCDVIAYGQHQMRDFHLRRRHSEYYGGFLINPHIQKSLQLTHITKSGKRG